MEIESSRNALAEFDNINDVLEAFNNPDIPGCAIALAVMKNGEVIHTAGYGFGQLEWRIPITPKTVF